MQYRQWHEGTGTKAARGSEVQVGDFYMFFFIILALNPKHKK